MSAEQHPSKLGAKRDPLISSAPEIAVVIPTRDREARLARALEALANQSLEPERFEVIVVRAADTPRPWTEGPGELRVHFIAHRGPGGAAAQRNVGWRETAAPLVAFTDDDCRPHPDWLSGLIAAADGGPAVVQGRTEPDPEEAALLFGLARTIEVTAPSEEFETCNIAYPRELLERVGGFDEEITAAWTEDTDLGLRAIAAGASRRFAGDALVWHAVVPRTLGESLRETARYEWLVRLLARHPEYRRRRFPHRLLKPSHLTLPIALAGLAAARRRPALALACAAPYVAGHLMTHLETNPVTPRSLAIFAAHLPRPALVDLAEVAVVLAAAARHRTLVL